MGSFTMLGFCIHRQKHTDQTVCFFDRYQGEAATHEVSMGIACEVTICRINPTAAVNSPGLHNGGNLLPFR